jgi:hypothetical protein
MYDDFNTCNKQYEYLEALRDLIISQSNDILKKSTDAIAKYNKASATAFALSNNTANDKLKRDEAIKRANLFRKIEIISDDFFGIKTVIQIDVTRPNPVGVYVCQVYSVKPAPSAYKHADQFKEKFNIYEHNDIIKHEAIDTNTKRELAGISGRIAGHDKKTAARLSLNIIAKKYRLQPFKSFTLAPGLNLISMLNKYIQNTDDTKSGCKNGRRTYEYLLDFISDSKNEKLIAGMINNIRNPGERLDELEGYIEKYSGDYTSFEEPNPREIAEYNPDTVDNILVGLNNPSRIDSIANRLVAAADAREKAVMSQARKEEGFGRSFEDNKMDSARAIEEEKEASKASKRKDAEEKEASLRSLEEAKPPQTRIIDMLKLFIDEEDTDRETGIMTKIVKLYQENKNDDLDIAISNHVTQFKSRTKSKFEKKIYRLSNLLSIPAIFQVKKGGGKRITKKRKAHRATKTRRRTI